MRLFGKKHKAISAQDSIPYREISKDGICRVRRNVYSKTLQFYDINYKLEDKDRKTGIFESWCDCLNYFDSAIHVQLGFVNRHGGMKEYESIVDIKPVGDEYDDIRMEYARLLRHKLYAGNKGIRRSKYITFSVETKDIAEARPRLYQIESDIRANLKSMGVRTRRINGTERLGLLYDEFHIGDKAPLGFDFSKKNKGRTTKDAIAPEKFVFDSRSFQVGKWYGAASYISLSAAEISDEMLSDLLELELDITIAIHLSPMEQLEAVKLVKGKVSDIDRMKIDEQKRAVRAGYDMDILPADLNTYGDDAKELLKNLTTRNERLFQATIIVVNKACSVKELNNAIYQTQGIAQKHNCSLNRLQVQEDGLMSVLPLGVNFVPISRRLTTTAAAIFVPFRTQELFMDGESAYYGLNAVSNQMIMADRKRLKNPNGLILGTPGSGKSFSAKREITNVFFTTKDDIIVSDPESEYFPLVLALGGQVIRLSATSKDYINPMDLNMDYGEDDNPLGVKSDFILSLCELIMGNRDGIEAQERSVIDRCLPKVYQKYFMNPRPENMPILGDLYECLLAQPEEQARRISTALEIYVNGSLNVFNTMRV